jgi:hypothetical protein
MERKIPTRRLKLNELSRQAARATYRDQPTRLPLSDDVGRFITEAANGVNK